MALKLMSCFVCMSCWAAADRLRWTLTRFHFSKVNAKVIIYLFFFLSRWINMNATDVNHNIVSLWLNLNISWSSCYCSIAQFHTFSQFYLLNPYVDLFIPEADGPWWYVHGQWDNRSPWGGILDGWSDYVRVPSQAFISSDPGTGPVPGSAPETGQRCLLQHPPGPQARPRQE